MCLSSHRRRKLLLFKELQKEHGPGKFDFDPDFDFDSDFGFGYPALFRKISTHWERGIGKINNQLVKKALIW